MAGASAERVADRRRRPRATQAGRDPATAIAAAAAGTSRSPAASSSRVDATPRRREIGFFVVAVVSTRPRRSRGRRRCRVERPRRREIGFFVVAVVSPRPRRREVVVAVVSPRAPPAEVVVAVGRRRPSPSWPRSPTRRCSVPQVRLAFFCTTPGSSPPTTTGRPRRAPPLRLALRGVLPVVDVVVVDRDAGAELGPGRGAVRPTARRARRPSPLLLALALLLL